MVQPYMRYFATIDVVELAHTLDEWQSANPSVGILALFPEACRESVSVLQSLCRQRKIPLAGGIFPELIADNGFTREGVWLLRFDEMPYVALYEDLEAGRAGAIRASVEIVAGLRPQLSDSSKSATLFMLFDALVPNIATMLDEIYLQLANRVHYAGANAGSETFQPMPCLFNNERLIQNGVLVMLLTPSSRRYPRTWLLCATQEHHGHHHGWQPHSTDRLATRIRGLSGVGAGAVRGRDHSRELLPVRCTFSLRYHSR